MELLDSLERINEAAVFQKKSQAFKTKSQQFIQYELSVYKKSKSPQIPRL